MSSQNVFRFPVPDHRSRRLTPSRGHGMSPHGRAFYRQLWLMGLIHLPIMYAVMFTMVDTFDDVVHNLNTLYMAGMMATPMVILMPLLMRRMYPNRVLNLVVYAVSTLAFMALFYFMRNQAFIDDKELLRSMIPHHSGAVLMCEKAKLTDPEVVELCGKIIESQKSEIAQMNEILRRI